MPMASGVRKPVAKIHHPLIWQCAFGADRVEQQRDIDLGFPTLVVGIQVHVSCNSSRHLDAEQFCLEYQPCFYGTDMPPLTHKGCPCESKYVVDWKLAAIATKLRLRCPADIGKHRVSVHGFPLCSTPRHTHLIHLINATQLLRRESRCIDRMHVDMLVGICMIDSRIFQQASEMFALAANVPISIESSNIAEKGLTFPLLCSPTILRILASYSVRSHMKTQEKLQFLYLAVGHDPSQINAADVTRSLLRIQQSLAETLCDLVGHPLPYVRQAALDHVVFLLDAVGCECVQYFPLLLRSILLSIEAGFTVDVTYQILNQLQRLLEQSSISALRYWIEESLQLELFRLASTSQASILAIAIRLWMIAAARAKGDMRSSCSVARTIFELLEHQDLRVQSFAAEAWDFISEWFPISLQPVEILQYVRWIESYLECSEPDDKALNRMLKFMQRLPTFNCQYIRFHLSGKKIITDHELRHFATLIPSIQSRLYAQLHHESSLEFASFILLWQCLSSCIDAYNSTDPASKLTLASNVDPVVQTATAKMRTSSPSKTLLQALMCMFPVAENNSSLMEFFTVFLHWIPNSTHDESFCVLDNLLEVLGSHLSWEHIQCAIHALTDRYTVRTGASASSKENVQKLLVDLNFVPNLLVYLSHRIDNIRSIGSKPAATDGILDLIDVANNSLLILLRGEFEPLDSSRLNPATWMHNLIAVSDAQIILKTIQLIGTIADVAAAHMNRNQNNDGCCLLRHLINVLLQCSQITFIGAECRFALIDTLQSVCVHLGRGIPPYTFELLHNWSIYSPWASLRQMCHWSLLQLPLHEWDNGQQDGDACGEQASIIWRTVLDESRSSWSDSRIFSMRLIWVASQRDLSCLDDEYWKVIDNLQYDWSADVRYIVKLLQNSVESREGDATLNDFGSKPRALVIEDLDIYPQATTSISVSSSPERHLIDPTEQHDSESTSTISEALEDLGIIDLDDSDESELESSFRQIEEMKPSQSNEYDFSDNAFEEEHVEENEGPIYGQGGLVSQEVTDDWQRVFYPALNDRTEPAQDAKERIAPVVATCDMPSVSSLDMPSVTAKPDRDISMSFHQIAPQETIIEKICQDLLGDTVGEPLDNDPSVPFNNATKTAFSSQQRATSFEPNLPQKIDSRQGETRSSRRLSANFAVGEPGAQNTSSNEIQIGYIDAPIDLSSIEFSWADPGDSWSMSEVMEGDSSEFPKTANAFSSLKPQPLAMNHTVSVHVQRDAK